MQICTLAGGLQFHKTMKRLCLCAYSICYRCNINISFYLSYPAIIHCKLTQVRGVLYCSILEHLRQQNILEWVSVMKDAGIGTFIFAYGGFYTEWNHVVTCSFHWGKRADQSVLFTIFMVLSWCKIWGFKHMQLCSDGMMFRFLLNTV